MRLSISYTQVYANGAKSKTIVKSPIQVCNSLIYVTDTVLRFGSMKEPLPPGFFPSLLSLFGIVGK